MTILPDQQPPTPDYLLRILGPPRVEAGDADLVDGLSPLLLILLAYLALQQKPQPRDQLARLLWPGSTGSRARQSLRQALTRIRRCLPGAIVTSNDHLGVDRAVLDTDLRRLEAALRKGALDEASRLWRGDFLEGVSRPVSWELEEWLDRERIRIQRLMETTFSEAAQNLLAASQPSAAADLLGSLRASSPSDTLQLLHCRALVAAGRCAEAEALLSGLDLEEDDGRLQELLDALERSRLASSETMDFPSEAPAEPAPARSGTAQPPDTDPELGGEPPGPPLEAPAHPSPPSSRPRRRGLSVLVSVGILGIVAVALLLLGIRTALDTPLIPPSFEAEIWFCSHRETEWAFRMDQDGRAKRSVSSQEVCPVLPYNGGREAVALRNHEDAAEVFRLVGRTTELLARLPGPAFVTQPPRQAGPLDGVISPDGRWLVLTMITPPGAGESPPVHPLPGLPFGQRPDAIWSLVLLDLQDGSHEEIARSGTRDYGGRFSPDGSRLVWISERNGAGDLYSMDLRTRDVTRLTSHQLPDREFSLADHRLVLRRGWWDDPEGREELVLLYLATGEEERLTENDWNDAAPDLSAGGKAVCWTSKEEGHFESEILVMDLATRAVTNVSDSPGRDDYCQWHPTEPVVFWQSWRDGNEQIYRSQWGPAPPGVNLSRYPSDDNWPAVVAPR